MLKDLAIHYECLPGENMSYFVVDSVFICEISLNYAKTMQQKVEQRNCTSESQCLEPLEL